MAASPSPTTTFSYVLSTFIYEPIRWNAHFGWRRLVERERLGYFEFWRAVGSRMGIGHIPDDYAAFESFSREYERRNFHFDPATQRVGVNIREMFARWFAPPLRPIVRQSMYAMMDEPMLRALGFPRPHRGVRTLVVTAMQARSLLLRLLPRRRSPVLRTSMSHHTYPRGYQIDRLGPP